MSARMTLTIEPSGHVEIAYDDALYGQGRVTRRFSTPGRLRPGYVIEHLGNGRTSQVCERLAGTGSTLSCTVDQLPDVIRREYRAMRRVEAKLAPREAGGAS
jgi:hypothetical protein